MHLCNSDDLSEIELPEDLDEVHNIMITEIKERVESTYKIKPNQYQIISIYTDSLEKTPGALVIK